MTIKIIEPTFTIDPSIIVDSNNASPEDIRNSVNIHKALSIFNIMVDGEKTLFIFNDFFVFLDGVLSDGFKSQDLPEERLKSLINILKPSKEFGSFDICSLIDVDSVDFSNYDRIFIYYDADFPIGRKGDNVILKSFYDHLIKNHSDKITLVLEPMFLDIWISFFKNQNINYSLNTYNGNYALKNPFKKK